MSRLVLAVSLFVSLGAAEVLTGPYRAVTLEHGQTRFFRVPNLERVTGSTGKCVTEGMNGDEPNTFFLEAECGGVRTTMVWLKDGSRLNVMACAEDEGATPALVTLRKQVQGAVKAWSTVTACIRADHVEVWGWVKTDEELKKVAALEKKYGFERVKNKVELIEE